MKASWQGIRRGILAGLGVWFLAFPIDSWACAGCMVGRLAGREGRAATQAVLVLLAVLGIVYGGILAFGRRLWKRARSPLPPYAQFTRIDEEEEDPSEVGRHDY
jgi:hypothetical protein